MPLLSICIPTFNRAYYLRRAVKHIVRQPVFQTTDDVEIVISDNASQDNTQAVLAPFLAAHPDKIFYVRQSSPEIGEKNFEAVLRAGRGEFLKLCNDTVLMKDGALSGMLAFIREHRKQRPLLFFPNQPTDGPVLCETMDDFVRRVSYWVTWVGAFGMWREDLAVMDDFSRYAHSHLIQADVMLRLIASGRQAALYPVEFAQVQRAYKVGGYNAAEVFGHSYFDLYPQYVKAGLLSACVYEKERKKTLYHQITPHYFDFKRRHKLNKTGYIRHLSACYRDMFFYLSFPLIWYKSFIFFIKNKIHSHAYFMKKQWNFFNANNQVTFAHFEALTKRDMHKVLVGYDSRGKLDVVFTDDPKEQLILGDNVVLGDNVRFIFGDTRLETGGTEAHGALEHGLPPNMEPGAARRIVVEDNVRIGAGSRIMAGVTLGEGAVIAANSHITQDVPSCPVEDSRCFAGSKEERV